MPKFAKRLNAAALHLGTTASLCNGGDVEFRKHLWNRRGTTTQYRCKAHIRDSDIASRHLERSRV